MILDTYVKAIESELECWPGTEATVLRRRKHRAVRISYGRHVRSIIIPTTGSDHRGPKNTVTQLRRTLKDMGATKLEKRPATKKAMKAAVADAQAVARVGVNNTSVVFSVPKNSPLYDRFIENGQTKSYWSFELRSNPDLKSAPYLAVVKRDEPVGVARGVAKGFLNKQTNGFYLAIMRNQFKAIEKLGTFTSQPIELFQDSDDMMLFKLPANRKPLARKHREEEAPVKPKPEPEVTRAEEPIRTAPIRQVPVAEPEEARSKSSQQQPTPLVIQAPKEAVSLERAINVINKHKEKMGDNLRLSISEGGFLAAIAKLGRR